MQQIETITRNGKPYAVLPLSDYQSLLEDMEDLKMLPKLVALSNAYTQGEIEGFPADFGQRLTEAKTTGDRVRLWREYRGISKAALGDASGASGQYISMIESGKREGTLGIFQAIAGALRCDLDDLLP